MPRAAELVDRYREVVSYCAPCGDVAPGIPFRANAKSSILMRGPGELVVLVNGREMPLHSTYVRTEPGWYRNLAVLLDLPAPGAAPSLRVEHAGTAGELISAGGAGLERETDADAFAARPMLSQGEGAIAEAAVGEPSVMIVSSGDRGAVALALLALVVSGVASGCMLWILLALRLRRRRSMRPRAMHLPK